ncbi:MAG: hypothetical protein K2P81_14840 [Bacteriovoracaceae bacterium]|nr:hypothetical protein [Bacteriovoracaceae bacterium]
MKGYLFRRVIVFCGCFIYLNACQAPLEARELDETPQAFSREELIAAGAEPSYENYIVAVQEELREEVSQDEASDFFNP